MREIRLIIIIYLVSVLLISCSKNISGEKISDTEENTSNIEKNISDIEEKINGIKEYINGKQDDMGESEESPSVNKRAYYFFTVPSGEEFNDLILNNPIDEDTDFFENSDFDSILLEVNKNLEYCTLWEAEIDAALQQLEELLYMEDYQRLLESHEAWESYMDSVSSLELSMFGPSGKYIFLEDGSISKIAGSNAYMLTAWVKAQRTRAHAIEILSYVYALTGEINYVYQSN